MEDRWDTQEHVLQAFDALGLLQYGFADLTQSETRKGPRRDPFEFSEIWNGRTGGDSDWGCSTSGHDGQADSDRSGHLAQRLEVLHPRRRKGRRRDQALLLVSNVGLSASEKEGRKQGEKNQRSSTMKENFIAGASASFLSKLILQPFDTTKTILQSSTNNYKNLIDCAIGVVKTQGVMGLYRGFGAGIGTSAPSSAIFFATYEAVKKWTEAKFPQSLGKVGPIVAAAVGNVVASVVRVPPEVVKQRVQARVYPNMITAITEMSRTEGIGGFYIGYGIQLARDIPYAAIQFMTFETLKKTYGVNRPQEAGAPKRPVASEAKKVLTNLWMGAVAGLVASVVTTPMDVVKTRVMTQDLTQGAAKIGVRQTVRSILKHEGPMAFTYGMLPRVMLKVPASALFLVAYEGMKRLLIGLEVTQRAAQLVKLRAARELAKKAKKAAKAKQREENRSQQNMQPETSDGSELLQESELEDLSSSRAMSEALLASMVLTRPTTRGLKKSLQMRKRVLERKVKKKVR